MSKVGNEQSPKKNYYEFKLDNNRTITISSKFDNGNISLIKQQNQLSYRLTSVADCLNGSNKKCWFYFLMTGPKNIQVKIVIENVWILQAVYDEVSSLKPVFKQGIDGTWQQIKNSFLINRDQSELNFDHIFNQSGKQVYFALTIPFSFSQNQQYIRSLHYKIPDGVLLNDQIICSSPGGRPIHILTIQEGQKEIKSKEKLIQTVTGYTKPIVLITARVHPGQVSSSYCLMGMIELLLSYSSLQAYLLRKMFKFIIVPLLNPDGVYEGNYRMDANGVNLNRVYSHPQEDKHSAIFHIRNYIQERSKQARIQYYFDLHSHSSYKPSYIYGNAYDDILLQTESQLFCKILQHHNSNFKYNLSLFGQKHMKSKDKGQILTKEGCGRVVISKLANVTNSYTVETSIFSYPPSETVNQYQPMNQNFQIGQFYLQRRQKFGRDRVVQQNMQLGEAILISILEHVDKNPYYRLTKQIKDQYRKQISSNLFQNEQRFKMLDVKAYTKVKNIAKCCQQQFQNRNLKQWSWLGSDPVLCSVNWPQGFKWFPFFINKQVIKNISKLKTESSEPTQKVTARQIQNGDQSKCFPKKCQRQRFTLVTKQVICLLQNEIEISEKTKKLRQIKSSIKYENDLMAKSGKVQSPKNEKDIQENYNQIPKNNRIIDFIKEEMNKLNQKKNSSKVMPILNSKPFKPKISAERSSAKKNSYNDTGSYSMQKLIKSSFNDRIYDNVDNDVMVMNIKTIQQEIDVYSDNKPLMRQRCMTLNDKQIDNEKIKRLNTLNSKRQIIKSKQQEIKRKMNGQKVRLPQLSKVKLVVDTRIKKPKKQTIFS